MTQWTEDESKNPLFSAEGGAFEVRILPPVAGLRTPRWKTETKTFGRWDADYLSYDSLDEAKADVEDRYRHVVELRSLPRQRDTFMTEQKRTPWGIADSKTVYGEGVVCYGTPGHGGFHLDRKRNAKVHPALRKACGDGSFYEEDGAYAAVILTFPELFTERERRISLVTMKNDYPHAYMAATGEPLSPAESRTLRVEEHARAHASDWQAIAASHDEARPGMVQVIATIGGVRSNFTTTVDEKVFLVPASEYKTGEVSFVIDPSRHAELTAAPTPTP